jgi:hypothetical protein
VDAGHERAAGHTAGVYDAMLPPFSPGHGSPLHGADTERTEAHCSPQTTRAESPGVEPSVKTAARLLRIAFAVAAIMPAAQTAAAPGGSVAAHDGQWSTATLSAGRTEPVVATVGAKALFAAGCKNGCASPHSWEPSDAVDVYDAATDQWSATTLSAPRSQLGVATVGSKVLFAGGVRSSFGPVSAAVDIYDAATDSWSTATLATVRARIAATTVGSKAVFAGGYTLEQGSVKPLHDVDIYDAATDQWSTASLTVSGWDLPITTVGDRVLVGSSKQVDVYDATSDQWTVAPLSVERSSYAIATVGTSALFAGGSTCGAPTPASTVCNPQPSNAIDIYDAATGQWSTATLSRPRDHVVATAVGSTVILAGGLGPNQRPSTAVDIFDAATGAWSTTTLPHTASQASATAFGSQMVYVSGPNIDLYDTATGQWSSHSRASSGYPTRFAAVGGQLVLADGSRLDILDGASGQWTAATLSLVRGGYGVAVAGPRVLFAGGGASRNQPGTDSPYVPLVDIYDTTPAE